MGFQLLEAASSADALRDFLSDTTVRTYNEKYGTQIEYFSKSGKTYLLSPGNDRISIGEWKAQPPEADGQAEICLRYREAGINSAIPAHLRDWNCRPAYGLFFAMKEVAYGNPLDLREGPAPILLPASGEVSLNRAMAVAGRKGEIQQKWKE